MNVLHVVGGFDISGRSRLIHEMSCALKGEGFRFTIASVTDSLAYRQKDIECVALGKGDGVNLSAIAGLIRIIKARGISVLHSHGRGGLTYAALAGRLSPARGLVHTVHRAGGDLVSGKWLARKVVLNCVNVIVGVSDAARLEFARANGFPVSKTVTIHNGIDVSRFARNDRNRVNGSESTLSPVIGTVANLSHDKDADTLLKGFTEIVRVFPDARLVVVGDGPKAGQARLLAAEVGIEHRVEFLGFRTDVPDILPTFDVFVYSTNTEGFGLALVEAMAAKVPVAASCTGGIPEVIEDGVSGKLFKPGDPLALRDAVLTLVEDKGLRDRMTANGYERVREKFSLGRMCGEYNKVYRGI